MWKIESRIKCVWSLNLGFFQGYQVFGSPFFSPLCVCVWLPNRCVPYRLKPVDEDDKNGFYVKKKEDDMVDLIYRLEFLMISSPDRHDLVFPKVRNQSILFSSLVSSPWLCRIIVLTKYFDNQGGWENDETMGQAACREALEEAGVRGILNVGSSSSFYCLKYGMVFLWLWTHFLMKKN